MKKTFLGFLSIYGSLVILLTMVGCYAGKYGPSDPSPPPPATGSIQDWPKAVQEAITASPDLVLGALGTVELQSFRSIVEQIKGLEPGLESDTDKGLALVDRANQLVATIMPEWKPVGVYKLGTSPFCELASSFVTLTNTFTKLAEFKAKQHAFNHGNEFSWPGFVQTVWADVSADRAAWAVENGSSVQDANEAINELGSVIWHAGEARNFELQSFLVTGDPDAKSVANILENVSIMAQAAIEWLNVCKGTL